MVKADDDLEDALRSSSNSQNSDGDDSAGIQNLEESKKTPATPDEHDNSKQEKMLQKINTFRDKLNQAHIQSEDEETIEANDVLN